jgi:hypothetical protein
MHESIAKSLRKGEQRKADTRLDEFNDAAINRSLKPNITGNTFDAYKKILAGIEEAYGSYLLLSHRPRVASKKHFETQLLGIDPDPTFIQNYGNVYKIALEIHSSRKAIQGKSAFKYFELIIGLHEHFLQRGFQRVEIENSNELNFIIMALINHLINAKLSLEVEDQHCYLILENYIVVCDLLASSNFKLIFKTILLQDRMTDYQNSIYDKAISYLPNYQFVLSLPASDLFYPFNKQTVKDYKKAIKSVPHLFIDTDL